MKNEEIKEVVKPEVFAERAAVAEAVVEALRQIEPEDPYFCEALDLINEIFDSTRVLGKLFGEIALNLAEQQKSEREAVISRLCQGLKEESEGKIGALENRAIQVCETIFKEL